VGTKVKEFNGSNFRQGKSKYLVTEACEHEESFLSYYPQIIVITNIEAEHLDYYKNLKNVIRGFKRFVSHLPKGGVLIINKDDKNISKIPACRQAGKIQKYSIKQKEAGKFKKILKVPGEHNVYNALAALTVARQLGVADKISFKALSEFKGVWRRFEIKEGKAGNKKITVVSDYGHHPTEVLATLKAAREKYPKKFILLVFQPHQHQRTHYLFNDFVKIFQQARDSRLVDEIIITDIYDVAGRETKKISAGVSSEKLVEKIAKNNVRYLLLCDIEKYIKDNIKSGDVLIVMGAGDIYKLADKF